MCSIDSKYDINTNSFLVINNNSILNRGSAILVPYCRGSLF